MEQPAWPGSGWDSPAPQKRHSKRPERSWYLPLGHCAHCAGAPGMSAVILKWPIMHGAHMRSMAAVGGAVSYWPAPHGGLRAAHILSAAAVACMASNWPAPQPPPCERHWRSLFGVGGCASYSWAEQDVTAWQMALLWGVPSMMVNCAGNAHATATRHAVRPGRSWYLPASQAVQAVALAPGEYEPAAHFVQ